MTKRNTHKTVRFILTFVLMSVWIFQESRAADGGGTNTVSPSSATVSSTGNTFTFTYTGDATKDSGGMTIAVPSGWSAPQGTGGTAGYTTVSSTGTIGDVKNVLDATTNWTAGNHMTLSADTSDYQTSTGSISNAITAQAAANEQWYYNDTSSACSSPTETGQKWGGNNGTLGLHIGGWLKSSVNTSSGDLYWQDDNDQNLASPTGGSTAANSFATLGDTISITTALTADTWTYTSWALTDQTFDFRGCIHSYGFRYTTDLGSATIKVDDLSIMFDDGDVNVNWSGDTGITYSSLTSGHKEGTGARRCAYPLNSGTGTSGDCFRSRVAGNEEYWGPGTTMSFWIRSSIDTTSDGAGGTTSFSWLGDNSSALASVEDNVAIPALTANTWTYVTVTAPNSANLNGLSWGIRRNTGTAAVTIDIDAMGKVFDTGDSISSWTAAGTGNQALSADTGTKQEGTGSLKNTIAAGAAAGDKWWETFSSPEDWSSYTTVGLWMRSSVTTTSGQLQFEYDDTDQLASPIATLDVGALTANTWSYQKLTLSGTRTSIKSYGIKYTTDIGAANVNLDYFLLGPGSLSFSGSGPWTIAGIFLALANTQTVTVTYGSGGGSSGVTAPSSAGTSTFTTQTRDAVTGTLTNISSSPTIEVTSDSQSLTFSISDNSIGFGTLSASAARYATGDTSGSASETEAHTLAASTNATSGYTISVQGATLTHTVTSSYTIAAIGGTNSASSAGSEQFGLRIAVTSGTGTATSPYAASGFAYAANATTSDEVASGAGDGTSTTFSARYIANITAATEAGDYSTALTYVATGAF